MAISNSAIGFREFLLRVLPRLAGDEVNNLIFVLRYQGFGRGLQLDGSDAQFGGSKGAGDEGGSDDCQDENRRNLQALGALINIQYGRVAEG